MKIIQILKGYEGQLLALGDDGRIYVGEFYVLEGNAPTEQEFRWIDKLREVPEELVDD